MTRGMLVKEGSETFVIECSMELIYSQRNLNEI